MSNLTDLLPAGAGGKQVDFVASGTIGNGVTVALKTDGTVEAVAETNITQGVGSNTPFQTTGEATYISSTYDSSNKKIVVCYRNESDGYGKAVVGTVSGTSITFGTSVSFQTSSVTYVSATYDLTNNKVVIAYKHNANSNYGTAIVGTVSGTSVSFGSPVVFNSAASNWVNITYNSGNSNVVICYEDSGNSQNGTGIVGTVSGTSISFGSESTFGASGATPAQIKNVYDSFNDKIVVLYQDQLNSNYGKAVVGTVSGTSISFGAEVTFDTGSTQDIAATYDSLNSKIAVFYRDGNNSAYGTGIIGTVSGTSISFGSPVVFESAGIDWPSCDYNVAANKIIVAYQDKGNSDTGTYVEGTISGTSISFNTPTIFPSEADAIYTFVTYDSDQYAAVISFFNIDNISDPSSFVYQSNATLTNNTSFIGISDAAISDTASGSVTIKGGISTNVTGLTPNATYYVQSDGSLSTTASSVLAGKALSSTSINLDYTT